MNAKKLHETVSATHSDSATTTYNLTGAELMKLPLVLDYNCRAPSRRSKAYIAMRETLKDAPELFINLNGGITISGNHLLDGGHTNLAIRDAIKSGELADADRVQVKVTDMGKLSKDEMAARTVALNRRVTPPLSGERDVLGHWEKLKVYASPVKIFEFRPNTNEEASYDVSFLVALLNGWYSNTAEKSYSSKGTLVRLYNDDKYSKLLPLLPKMAEVYSAIYEMLLSNEKAINVLAGYIPNRIVTLPNGKRTEGFLPEAFVWSIYGAFAGLINAEGEFEQDPIELLEKKKGIIIKTLLADYKKTGSAPAKYGKDPKSYANMIYAVLNARS